MYVARPGLKFNPDLSSPLTALYELQCTSILSRLKHLLIIDSELGLAGLIEISVNWSIYKRKTIIDMKIQKSVTFNEEA